MTVCFLTDSSGWLRPLCVGTLADSHVVENTPAAVRITRAQTFCTCAVLLAGFHWDLGHLQSDRCSHVNRNTFKHGKEDRADSFLFHQKQEFPFPFPQWQPMTVWDKFPLNSHLNKPFPVIPDNKDPFFFILLLWHSVAFSVVAPATWEIFWLICETMWNLTTVVSKAFDSHWHFPIVTCCGMIPVLPKLLDSCNASSSRRILVTQHRPSPTPPSSTWAWLFPTFSLVQIWMYDASNFLM